MARSNNAILKRDKVMPHTFFTPDKSFKVFRCTVAAYGWDISERTGSGIYRIISHASTLYEARRRVVDLSQAKLGRSELPKRNVR